MFKRLSLGIGVLILAVTPLVVWLVLTSFWLYQSQHAYKGARASDHYEYTAEDVVRRCLGDSSPTFSEGILCLAEAIEAGREAQYAKYDLDAQQDMAEWAYGLLWISLGGLVITTAGVVFVAWTLRTAVAANEIARKVGEAQVRAYISVKPIHISSFDSNNFVSARLEIKNTGDSPAFKVRHSARIALLPASLPSGYIFPPIDVPEVSGLSIFPGAHIEGVVRAGKTISPRDRVRIRQGKLTVYVWAEVHYQDFIGTETRHTRFAGRVSFEREMLRKLTMNYPKDDLKVAFAYPDQHNDAD